MPANPGAIRDKGANLLAVAEVTDAWALKTLTAGTNALHYGHLTSSSLGQTTSKETFNSEDGKPRLSEFTYSLDTTGVLMQADKVIIDFNSESVKDKYFLQYKLMSLNRDGKKQEHFSLGQVTPQFKVDAPGGTASMPYEFSGIYPDATVTFNSTMLVAIETALSITIYCTGVSITASQGFCIKETA